MIFRVIIASIAIACISSAAEARRAPVDLSQEFIGDRYSGYAPAQAPQVYVVKKSKKAYRKAKRQVAAVAKVVQGALAQHVTKDLTGFPEPLVAKVRELERECGSKIVSAFRPGARIARTGVLSNHAKRKAVDMAGNPACMYAHLKGFRGGVSTDYHSAPGGKHIHISYNPGGPEWGKRFAHSGGKGRVRYAKKRVRYAGAG
jgi:hypothetical protein